MTFVSLIRFTPQGIAEIHDTCRRADAFKSAAKKMGVKVTDIFWTQGRYDGVLVMDAPDEETAAAALLGLASKGNVQTQTSRAYRAAEMKAILAKLG